MSTVYVFGAGASRDVGYPLASEMGDGLLDYMLESADPMARPSAEYLIDHFGKSPNIEDLITELQVRIDALKGSQISEEKTERMRLGNRRGSLGNSIREWFRTIHLNPAPTYAEFSNRIALPGDIVITFNYDDSLERELKRSGKWDISLGYGFPFGVAEDSSDVTVLKLHGSINWLVSLFGGATGGAFIVNPTSSMGDRPVIHQADLQFLGYDNFLGHTYQSGGAFPCLIMPGRKKEFFYDTSLGHEYTEFWNNLWSQATETLRGCDRLIVCGYSLLPVDERACDLLLKQPRKGISVEVIAGSQTDRIVNDFRTGGFSDVQGFKGGYFKDWVEAQP